MKKPFKILSIDGGGIRGVYSAALLQSIEEKLKIRVSDHFDFFAGTSTGSIVSAAIACDYTGKKVVELYKQDGAKIFKRKSTLLPENIQQLFESVYESKNLSDVLTTLFQDRTLSSIEKRLMILATNISKGQIQIFKSRNNEDKEQDNLLLVQALTASCSAPTFFDPQELGGSLMADGGLWANNPTLTAISEVRYSLGVDLNDIHVLSLGNGRYVPSYGDEKPSGWGFFTGWKSSQFIGFTLSLENVSELSYLHDLLPDRLLRINFDAASYPIDDVTKIDAIIAQADKDYSQNESQIKKFFAS